MLEACLRDLEQRIDETEEVRLWDAWRGFADGQSGDAVFIPRRSRVSPPGMAWPEVSVNAAQKSFETMAIHQLSMCSAALAGGGGEILSVRCNYGVGIIPSLFGAKLFVMDVAAGTLPTSVPLEGGLDAIKALVGRGVPDLHQAVGGQTLEMAAYFQEVLVRHPKIQRHVHLYHPDLQGPIDLAELLVGSGLFLALIQVPELIKDLLALLTETYIRFMREWERIVPPSGSLSVHWSMMHRGRVMLRNDSAMNLSPDMYEEFIGPYDQQVLDAFGGGAMHFCGRGDHYIGLASRLKGLYAVNMSQPGHNDMRVILENTASRGIKLIGFPSADLASIPPSLGAARGNVHAWS